MPLFGRFECTPSEYAEQDAAAGWIGARTITDAELAHPLLQLVPEPDRIRAGVKAVQVGVDNTTWATERLGASGPKLCKNLAYAGAAIAPRLPRHKLALFNRFTLWTFVIDNMLDDPAAGPDDVRATGNAVRRSLAAGSVDGNDNPAVRVLWELIPELAAQHGEDALTPFADALDDDIAGSIQHSLLSRSVTAGHEPAPTAEDYLPVAARSINYRAVAHVLLLLVLDDPRSWQAHLGTLNDALTAACRAIRLANDLRSVERHRKEGALNVLLLNTAEGAPAQRHDIEKQIEQHVHDHDSALAELPGGTSSAAAAALINSLRVSVGVYRVGQLR
jgi:hypothetical protein